MLKLVLSLLLVMCATAHAKVLQLPPHTIDQVRAKCARVHGAFFLRDGDVYGCSFARGTVQCTGGQCQGFPAPRRHAPATTPPLPPEQQPEPWGYRERWPQDRW